MSIQAVLFDLDGTFADTAPDLAAALNQLLQEQGKSALPFEHIRPVVSHGGIALIKLGFDIPQESPEFEALRQRLLAIYKNNISQLTRLFEGMDELVTELENSDIAWGIVTNKPGWLTNPLMVQLGYSQRAGTIVSGDTTKERKPHPEPLLYACREINCQPEQCLYVGDAQRDIIAGKRAGMKTLGALFGYIEADDDPQTWGADALIKHPREIKSFL